MSAIFGIFCLDKSPVNKADLEQMGAALRPYGPERMGTWSSNHVGLGHGLMPFFLADRFEKQPLISPDNNTVVVFDGRLHNRMDLMADLGMSTDNRSDLPDSLLIEKAYQRWGQKCLDHVIGHFAVAVWDGMDQVLFIARSPFGSPPLFYHASSRMVAFATMYKGLFALPKIHRSLDQEILAGYLCMIPSDPEQTFYQGIKRLPGGHCLCLRPGEVTRKRFWKMDLNQSIDYPGDNDYQEAFDALITKVIREHVSSAGTMGIMMSGGLDSSSIAVIAASCLQAHGRRLAAFTEVPRPGLNAPLPKGRYADETPYVRAIQEMIGNLDLHLVRTDGQTYLDGLENLFEAAEVPFRNASNRVYYEAILQMAGGLGVRTLLSGGQGNMTISWTGSGLLPQLLKQWKILGAWKEAAALSRQGFSKTAMHAFLGQGVMPLLPLPLWLIIQGIRSREAASLKRLKSKQPWQEVSIVNPGFAEKHRVFEQALELGHTFVARLSADTRLQRLRILENPGRLMDGLETGSQARFGVSVIDPTMDQRIVEFCMALPEEQFLKNGVPKRLIRRSMQGKLPDCVLWNPKRGLQAADWFERLVSSHPKIMETLDTIQSSDLACEALDMPRLRQLAETLPSRSNQSPEVLMRDYRMLLERGLMTGAFIAWVEKGRL